MSFMQWTKVSVPIASGVDTKSDALALNPPKMADVVNGVFDKRGSIRKRHGYTALEARTITGTALTSARALATRGDELLMFDDDKLYSRSPTHDLWNDRGTAQSVIPTLETVAKVRTEQTLPDRATADGVTLYAWQDSRGTVRYSLVSEDTGVVYYDDQDLGANTTRPKCIAINGSLHLLHVQTAAGELRTKVFHPLDLATGVAASPISMASDIDATALIYDVDVRGARGCFTYLTTTATRFKTGYLSAAGAATSVVAINIAGGFVALAICVEPNTDGIAVTYARVSGANVVGVIWWPDDLGGSSVQIDIADATVAAADVRNLTAAFEQNAVSAGVYRLRAFYEEKAVSNSNRKVYAASTLTNGTATLGTVLRRHSGIGSRAFRDQNTVYFVSTYESTLQNTYFVMRYDGTVVARLLAGTGGGVTPSMHLGHVETVDTRRYRWAATYRLRLDARITTTTAPAVYTERGIKVVTLDFGSSQSHRTGQLGAATYIAGGLLQQYDGLGVTESGFLLYPEGVTATPGAGGSMTPSVSYSYRAYYEWTNAAGEREQSTYAGAVTVTMGGADTQVTLMVPTLAVTAKRSPRANITIGFFRTGPNPTDDSPFYRVASLDPTTSGAAANGYTVNNPLADTVTFVDRMADTSLTSQEPDYQNAGAFDHLAPPSASVMVVGKDRVFLAGFENDSQVMYSLRRGDGEAVQFNDAALLDFDADGGPITALAVLDDNLIVFKAQRIFAVSGDGPNNFGQGAFGQPQLIASDVGCIDQRTVVLTPLGLMFQSAKGIWLLARGLGLQYLGAEVEAYNAQTFTSALIVPDSNQVRFLAESGRTLLYDYVLEQWATWTNHEGVGAVLWEMDGVYCYARSDGTVRQESATDFRDAGASYPLIIETPWLKFDGLQGFTRVRRWYMLGTWRSAHTIRATVFLDYEGAPVQVEEWDPAEALNLETWGDDATWGSGTPWGGDGSSVYQFRVDMAQQKGQSYKLRFEDLPGDPPGESYQMTDLTAEVGLKKGPFKSLPLAKRAGT